MTINEKLFYIRQDWLNCTESYGFGHYVDSNSKLIKLYQKTNLNPIEFKDKYSKDEILLINLLYKLIKEKNDIRQ